MFIHTDLHIPTQGHGDVVDLTDRLNKITAQYHVRDGFMICVVRGSTAALTTMEYEPNLVKDLKEVLERLIPSEQEYHHHKTWGDDNGHAHLRATLIGPSLHLIIRGGEILLGSWQQVVLLDFDTHPRERIVHVALYSETI